VGNKQIVIIDDSKAMLITIKSMLLELGYTNVVTSSDPQKAIETIHNNPDNYLAIFTDLNMPHLDGMEVIKQLGNISFKGGVCIVSQMETRVIRLASEIAKQHQVHLIGNIPKPVDSIDLQRVMTKLKQITERRFDHYQKMSHEELQQSIDQSLITPYYQPKIDTHNGRINGLEVLARICKPGVPNAILPGAFIPTAIQFDLINNITQQIIRKALAALPLLHKEFGQDICISVNLSPSQLMSASLPRELSQILSDAGVENSKVVLEITEEFSIKTTEQLESLNRFRMLGFGLSLDDFGTGYTNIQQLRSLPFTEVKIDRSLISNIHCDVFNQVVVRSLTELCPTLGVKLIAEGIENVEDLQYLEMNLKNIDMQGFLLCTPKPLDSLIRWYHSWNATVTN
jgi:EAL domain-containing protein (putative c-di-GMP-specific phosphodiesterase class I)